MSATDGEFLDLYLIIAFKKKNFWKKNEEENEIKCMNLLYLK